MENILNAAKSYREQGISFIPIKSPITAKSKKPALKSWTPYQDRIPSEIEIVRWFYSGDNQIAIVTGCVSGGLFVIDFDGPQWQRALEDFCRQFPEFTDTKSATTGSGKAHLYGKCPEMDRALTRKDTGHTEIQKALWASNLYPDEINTDVKTLTHIELRCNEVYVICPPSTREDGGNYSWDDSDKCPVLISKERLGEIVIWVDSFKQNKQDNKTTTEEDPNKQKPKSNFGNHVKSIPILDICHRLGMDTGSDLHGNCPTGHPSDGEKCFSIDTSTNKWSCFHCDLKEQDGIKLVEVVKWCTPNEAVLWLEIEFKVSKPDDSDYKSEGWNDEAVAVIFKSMFQGNVCYIKELEDWHRFNGVNWVEDKSWIKHRMIDTVNRKFEIDFENERQKQKPDYRSLAQSHNYFQNNSKIESCLKAAEKHLERKHNEFDKNPWDLVCSNGVVNLKTGEFRQATAEDSYLKNTNIEFNPEAQCPRWLQFLKEVFDGNQELISYIQRAVGYSLAGDVREDKFFILYGRGANGKTVFAETLLKMLGRYSADIPFSVLEEHKQSSSEDPATPNKAKLAGVRFVKSSETKPNSKFNTERLKNMTGGDSITARLLFKEPITFKPTHKLWITVNDKPMISDDSEGMWRRVDLIPFTVRFYKPEEPHPEGARLQDKTLRNEVLPRELGGILNWAIQGCLEWQSRGGLFPPREVTRMTEEYRQDNDIIVQFIDDEIVRDEGNFITTESVYKTYLRWCGQEGIKKPLSKKWLARKLSDKGFVSERPGGVGLRGFTGIRLINPVRDVDTCDAAIRDYRQKKQRDIPDGNHLDGDTFPCHLTEGGRLT